MKDEDRWLARCLSSVRGLVDEIIIVDTGSTDRSVEIAESFGAKVLIDPWQDDFARPRNTGLKQATKDWILILDPDEVVSKQDYRKIRELTRSSEFVAYRMDTRNYTQNRFMQGFRPNPGDYPEGQGWAGFTPSIKTRLFKNGLGFKFVGRWHEMVDYSIDYKKYKVTRVEVCAHHYAGEINQKTFNDRQQFYLRVGEKKVLDDPDNDQAWWELGVAEGIAGYYARAVRSILMSLRRGFTTPDRLFQLVYSLNQMGKRRLGRLAFEKAICMLFPNLTHYEDKYKPLSSLSGHF